MEQTIFITGSAKRIGKEIALFYAKKKFNILLHYNNSKNECEEVAAMIREHGNHVAIFKADLGNKVDCQKLASDLFASEITPDVIVNNASVFEYDSAEQVDVSLFEQHMNVNLLAPILLTEALSNSSKNGLIVNILDQRVENPSIGFFSYALSKQSLHHATILQAMELAHKNIRVNSVSLGPILKSKRQSTDDFNSQLSELPLNHYPTTDDICNAIDFFINVKTVTGNNIFIDGGSHLFQNLDAKE